MESKKALNHNKNKSFKRVSKPTKKQESKMKVKYNINTKPSVIKNAKIVLNAIENNYTPYATHFQDANGNLHHGGYFTNLNDAMDDFINRKQ